MWGCPPQMADKVINGLYYDPPFFIGNILEDWPR
jgi:hypothetical protein